MRNYLMLIAIFALSIFSGCNMTKFDVTDGALNQGSSLASQDGRNGPFAPKMTMLMGANGSPGSPTNLAFWREMGLRLSRVVIYPTNSTNAEDFKAKGYFDTSKDAEIKFNNDNGITTFILLAYTVSWNSVRAGDDKAAPKDVNVWKSYVEAVVKKYSAPPYNVKYFQVWNEAAGKLAGGSPQASFWHSSGDLNAPYASATQDYVDLIHIPAAQIIRNHGCYVIYGGWPDQGGINEYTQWLEYKSTIYNSTMLDWTDYLDTHYLGVNDMETFYTRYVGTGKIRGIWQSEVGFDYMNDHNYIASLFFRLAELALRSGWRHQDQFTMSVYHWAGGESFMLMNQSGQYHDSGTSLKTLTSLMTGTLSRFDKAIKYSAGASGLAVYNDKQIVFQVTAPAGTATIEVSDLPSPQENFTVSYKEAVFGTDLQSSIVSSSWSGGKLQIQLNVPAGRADLKGTLRNTMGYVIVTPN